MEELVYITQLYQHYSFGLADSADAVASLLMVTLPSFALSPKKMTSTVISSLEIVSKA